MGKTKISNINRILITIIGFLHLYFIRSDLGSRQSDHIDRMITLNVIILSGFYCTWIVEDLKGKYFSFSVERWSGFQRICHSVPPLHRQRLGRRVRVGRRQGRAREVHEVRRRRPEGLHHAIEEPTTGWTSGMPPYTPDPFTVHVYCPELTLISRNLGLFTKIQEEILIRYHSSTFLSIAQTIILYAEMLPVRELSFMYLKYWVILIGTCQQLSQQHLECSAHVKLSQYLRQQIIM